MDADDSNVVGRGGVGDLKDGRSAVSGTRAIARFVLTKQRYVRVKHIYTDASPRYSARSSARGSADFGNSGSDDWIARKKFTRDPEPVSTVPRK